MKTQSIKVAGIRSKNAPTIEISDEGLYVWFKRGVTAHKTIVKKQWPFVAVDVDKSGDVIGVEVVPFPSAFSINSILEPAGLKVSERMAAKTQIVPLARTQDAETLATA